MSNSKEEVFHMDQKEKKNQVRRTGEVMVRDGDLRAPINTPMKMKSI